METFFNEKIKKNREEYKPLATQNVQLRPLTFGEKNILMNIGLFINRAQEDINNERLISQNEIDIIFGRDKNGNYVMRIDEKNNSEMIDILDVESVSQNEKKENRIDISYMYNSKKYNISVLVHELVVDQFLDAYKNYYSESIKRHK